MARIQVISKKDQEQYWADRSKPYQYISVPDFAAHFKALHVGLQLEDQLAVPYDKARNHKAALVFSRNSIRKLGLLKASFDKEWLLIKRNRFVYVFKTTQIVMIAIIASTVFFRTTLDITYNDGSLYIGAIIFSMIINMFNGFAELSMTIMRLPVFYKHRDLLFYPAWAFTLPNFLLRIPLSVLESMVWMLMTYYTIGYAPEASRSVMHHFKQLYELLVYCMQKRMIKIKNLALFEKVCHLMKAGF